MSTVTITYKVNTDGQGFKTLTSDAEGFKKVIGASAVEVTGMKKQIFSLAAASAMFSQLEQALQGLNAVCTGLTEVYAVQEQAETQLATVMRERLDATDEEIQKIKELASAQQEIGVIGDEVQLAGAQQVATFLKQRDSLEALLPAMNDLLAQQKGLKATSQDAVTVANLMGKALQGQTGALRRVGISFDEAQEQVLKYGTESERVAMLSAVITQNVGHMNAALANTQSGRIKQMDNALGDFKETLGRVCGVLLPALSQGLAMTTGIANIGKAVTSVKALGISLKAAVASSKALRIALYSIGAAAAAFAIMEIVAALMSYADASGKAQAGAEGLKAAHDAYVSKASEVEAQMQGEAARLKDLMDAHADCSAAVSALNDKYSEAFGTHQQAADWYDILTTKSQEYSRQLALEAEAMSLRTSIAEKQIALEDAQEAMKKLEKTGKATVTSYASAYYVPGVSTAPVTTLAPQYVQLKNEAERLRNDLDALQERLTNRLGKIDGSTRPKKITPEVTPVKSLASLREAAPSPEKEAYVPGAIEELNTLKTLGDAITYYGKLRDEQNAAEAQQTQGIIAQLTRKRDLLAKEINLPGVMERYQNVPEMSDMEVDVLFNAIGLDNIRKDLSDLQALYLSGVLPPELEEQVEGISQAFDAYSASLDKNARETQQVAEQHPEEAISAAGSALNAIGGALKSAAGQWTQYGASVLNAVAQAIPQIAALTAASHAKSAAQKEEAVSGAAASVASVPFAGPVLAVAAIASVLAALLAVPKFAKGGVAYGPTLGVFGEYPGAATNPEVVAPLDRLRSLISDGNGGYKQISCVVEGTAIRCVLQKVNKKSSRS